MEGKPKGEGIVTHCYLGRRSLLQEETVEVTEVLEAERRGRKESPRFTTPPREVTLNWRRRHTPVCGEETKGVMGTDAGTLGL